MLISLPELVLDEDVVKLIATINSNGIQHELWYSLPVEYSNWFSTDRCDGFLVGLLLQAMERNEDILLEGPVSSRLFHNIQGFFIPMMAQAFPNLHPINIKTKSLLDEPTGGRGVCTGFSGGIDSFAAFIKHYINESSQGHKITHFLFHNSGSHGSSDPELAKKLFKERYEMLLPFANEIAIPLVMVDSNLIEIFDIDFIKMHSTLNASIPLVLQNQFQRYFYASTYKYLDCSVKGIDDIAHFDPLAFHLLSTEGLDCVSTGCEMSRVEKTNMVATYKPSYRYLNVCVDPTYEGLNCSVCFKCCRTIMTLELLGMVDLYRNVFDLEKFGKIRQNYILKLLLYKHDSFETEIVELYRVKRRGVIASAFSLRHWLGKLLH